MNTISVTQRNIPSMHMGHIYQERGNSVQGSHFILLSAYNTHILKIAKGKTKLGLEPARGVESEYAMRNPIGPQGGPPRGA